MGKQAYLVLETGKVFQGEYFGAEREVMAEVVFSTGMTGYLETLTDKSYYGQIVVQTFPLIGNYGVIPEDFESEGVSLSAYIVKDLCQMPSNFRSEGRLDTFFQENNIVGLKGIDTRALTKTIREVGVMNAVITTDPASVDRDRLKAYKVVNAVEHASTTQRYTLGASDARWHIALLDFGLKRNIYRELIRRGARVTVCPCNTTAAELAALKVDAIMLSNGPGNPADNTGIIENVREMITVGLPMFGICLGHQILALANGAKSEKLKYGHRGENQPVKNAETGKIYITSQNHGYAVLSDSLDPEKASVSFTNVNDGTNEGLRYHNFPGFSVQFHPEACAGPLDTAFLFDDFFGLIEAGGK